MQTNPLRLWRRLPHRWTSRVAIGALCALLAACGGGGEESPPPPPEPPPPVVLENVVRAWQFSEIRKGTSRSVIVDQGRKEGFGVIDKQLSMGLLQGAYLPDTLLDGERVTAYSKAYSDDTGRSYWVSTVAPRATPANEQAFGSESNLTEWHYWKKTAPDATLQYVVSFAYVEGTSANSPDPDKYWRDIAVAQLQMQAVNLTRNLSLMPTGGFSIYLVYAPPDGWIDVATPWGTPSVLHWDKNFDVDGPPAKHARIELVSPFIMNIPLDKVGVGETFVVKSIATAWTENVSQGESHFAAFLRDPAKTGGTGVDFIQHGLEPVKPPADPYIEITSPLPPVCSSAPNPAAGTLELVESSLSVAEGASALLRVTRSGGTQGEVSVRATLVGGTALAGSDFESRSIDVVFANGDASTHVIVFPTLDDTLVEGAETATVRLEDVRGCAALGAAATAALTIVDDDAAAVTYTVSGTLSGLQGSGLQLALAGRTSLTLAANGRFEFPWSLRDGEAYEVRIDVQPTNPAQSCVVTRGSGVVSQANVTDVAVSCAPPVANGALDPSFGGTGMVTNAGLRRALSIALQADGKAVVLSDQLRLSRYNSDGSVDTSFGTGGVVAVSFGTSSDVAYGLALQPDGRILVSGRTQGPTSRDFAATRYQVDGSVDTSFGNAGIVVADHAGENDEARVPLVQPDGHIVLAGNVLVRTGQGLLDQDFAALRLTADGAVDASFGTGGWVRVNLAGLADIATAATLESNGTIFIAGRAAADGGALPDVGLVRILADGSFASFLTFDFSGGNHDEATDVLMQADGRLLMAVNSRIGGKFVHALARLNADATPDTSFGSNGFVTQSFAVGGDFPRALALQGDGRIVSAGYTRTSATQTSEIDDFLVTRHNVDGSLDASFGNGGKVVVDFFGASDGASDLALLPDGRIVVAGSAQTGTRSDLALIRVAP